MQLNTLTFAALAAASYSRARRWHPEETMPRYQPADGMLGWSLSDWCTALTGEVGEAANIIKKLNRARNDMVGNKGITKEQLRFALAEELADIAIYLDLLAQAAGVNLGEQIIMKFNSTSIVNGFPERLGERGKDY